MTTRLLPILFFTLLLDMIGTGMIIPIIPIIFTDSSSSSFILHGFSQGQQFFIAGLVTALFGLMQFLASPLLGELSDVFGRKKLLLLGIAILAISQLFFGFGIAAKSLIILLISRAIAGLAAANFSIAQAAIADITAPQDRAKNFGLIGAAFGIGFIVGPLLGGWIAHFFQNAAAPFWFAGILGMINFFFCMFFLPETRKKLTQAHSFTIFKGIHNLLAAVKDTQARRVYLASFLYMAGFSFLISFSGVFLVSRFALSEGEIGTYFAATGVFIVLTQAVILRLITKKYNEKTILRFSLLALALTVASYPFMGNIALLYVLTPFIAIPQGLSIANMSALVSKSVSPERQGAAMGINGSLIALAQGFIPLLAGAGSAMIGITSPFLAGGMLIFAAWTVLFLRPTKSV